MNNQGFKKKVKRGFSSVSLALFVSQPPLSSLSPLNLSSSSIPLSVSQHRRQFPGRSPLPPPLPLSCLCILTLNPRLTFRVTPPTPLPPSLPLVSAPLWCSTAAQPHAVILKRSHTPSSTVASLHAWQTLGLMLNSLQEKCCTAMQLAFVFIGKDKYCAVSLSGIYGWQTLPLKAHIYLAQDAHKYFYLSCKTISWKVNNSYIFCVSFTDDCISDATHAGAMLAVRKCLCIKHENGI